MTANTTANVQLVPCGLTGTAQTYELLYATGAYRTWRTRGAVCGPQEFEVLIAGPLSFTVTTHNRQVIGFLGLYDYDQLSGTAYLSAFFDSTNADVVLLAGEAGRLYLREVFRSFGLRKLVIEIPSHIAVSARRLVEGSAPIRHEATLEEHTMMGGELRDVEVLSIFATDYLARYECAPPVAVEGVAALVFGHVRSLAACQGTDRVDGGARLVEDLGFDSLLYVELLDLLEADGVVVDDLPLDLGLDAATVQDLVAAIELHTVFKTDRADLR